MLGRWETGGSGPHRARRPDRGETVTTAVMPCDSPRARSMPEPELPSRFCGGRPKSMGLESQTGDSRERSDPHDGRVAAADARAGDRRRRSRAASAPTRSPSPARKWSTSAAAACCPASPIRTSISRVGRSPGGRSGSRKRPRRDERRARARGSRRRPARPVAARPGMARRRLASRRRRRRSTPSLGTSRRRAREGLPLALAQLRRAGAGDATLRRAGRRRRGRRQGRAHGILREESAWKFKEDHSTRRPRVPRGAA